MKRKYTIKQNRPIVKCPTCKTTIIEGEICPTCSNCKNCRFNGKLGITKSGGKMSCSFNYDFIPKHIPQEQRKEYVEKYQKTHIHLCEAYLPLGEDN